MNCCRGQEIISVANWTTDGAIRLEHCRSSTFLMSVHQATLTGVLSSDNCSGAAGTLVSQGPVTLRHSAKLIGWMLHAEEFTVQSRVLHWNLTSTKEMPSSTRPVPRKSGLADSNFFKFFCKWRQWQCCGCVVIVLSYCFPAERHNL